MRPSSVSDFATTIKNTAVNVSVLANDSDADGDALAITSTYQSPDGTAAIINNGTAVRFTPKLNFTGVTSFSYTISDGRGGTVNGFVQVNVNKR